MLPSAPLVSVIITTYKRPEYLRRSLSSVLSQTYSNIEVIIINDDPSVFYTSSQRGIWSDSRVQYINHSSNMGVSSARNSGLEVSKGDYICFLDDDDIWLPSKVDTQLNILAPTNERIGFSYCWSYILDSAHNNISSLSPRLQGNIFDQMLLRQCIPNISTIMIKASVLNLVSGFEVDLKRGNDSDFLRKLSYYFHVIPTEQYLVYYNDSNLHHRITNNTRSGLSNSIASLKYRQKFFKHQLDSRPYAKFFLDLQLMSLYLQSNHFQQGTLLFLSVFFFSLKLQLKLLYRLVTSIIIFPHA